MKKRGAALTLAFGLLAFLAGGAVVTANTPNLTGGLNAVALALTRPTPTATPLPTPTATAATAGGAMPGVLLAGLAALALLAVLAGLGAVVVGRLSATPAAVQPGDGGRDDWRLIL